MKKLGWVGMMTADVELEYGHVYTVFGLIWCPESRKQQRTNKEQKVTGGLSYFYNSLCVCCLFSWAARGPCSLCCKDQMWQHNQHCQSTPSLASRDDEFKHPLSVMSHPAHRRSIRVV